MKEYEITELMRKYTDDEFNIEGENAAHTDKVLENVMAQVKPKKKVKPLFKVLIAAAAAAVCVIVGTAAAIANPVVLTGRYITPTGTEFEYKVEGNGAYDVVTRGDVITPIKLEGGRLHFVLNGESVDITDIIDRETPYIYSYTIPEKEKLGYIIVGGTPEEYGYLELYYVEEAGWFSSGHAEGDHLSGYIGVVKRCNNNKLEISYSTVQLDDEGMVIQSVDDDGTIHLSRNTDHEHTSETGIPSADERDNCPEAWLLSAVEQIGII